MENTLKITLNSFTIKLRALLGFSRVMISSFALAQAALASVLALRGLPSVKIILLGSIACLSGSYALTATNDLFDYQIDRERLKNLRTVEGFDIGQIFIRQPLARGVICFRTGVIWILSLSTISLIFGYLIKPSLVLVSLIIGLLVVTYSAMSRLSILKLVIVGVLVSLGAAAGWLAVSNQSFLLLIFVLWMFFWEIGGRNIPNDFADIEEDKHLKLKTIPVEYGKKKASKICFSCLLVSFTISIVVAILADVSHFFVIAVSLIGILMLIFPGYRLLRKPEPQVSLQLFNFACFYPFAILTALLLSIYIL